MGGVGGSLKVLILIFAFFHSSLAMAEAWNDDPIKDWFGDYKVLSGEGRACSEGEFVKLKDDKGAYRLGTNIQFSHVNQPKSVETDDDCTYEVETMWVKPVITVTTHSRCGELQEDSVEKITFKKDAIDYERVDGKKKKVGETCKYVRIKK